MSRLGKVSDKRDEIIRRSIEDRRSSVQRLKKNIMIWLLKTRLSVCTRDESALLQSSDICCNFNRHTSISMVVRMASPRAPFIDVTCVPGIWVRARVGTASSWMAFLSVSRAPVDTSCPNSLYTELASKLYLYMALAIPILNGDLARNVYGVTMNTH